ncbi:uncharacterized protein [Blastocystis hominis]|uniref:Uncharacterized protein n=1 Tax=Blastocystis hominis TaxID=12968 RepID=D8M6N0_BLAHO|nr:uncharacterized protein [Blastocystis hominis]CBK23448.2 unnamed protein product [Blastocystis hominis]|eukprot:XP_012897496.1 uncharacterized protein [Blastocystis hominis]
MQVATEIYSCKPPTRVVVPFVGDLSSNRFLLATSNITDDNEIHLVEYNSRNKNVYSECIYKHNGQIFGLSPCPYDPELCFAIVGCDSDTKKGILYHLGNLPLTHISEEKDQDQDIPGEPEADNASADSISDAPDNLDSAENPSNPSHLEAAKDTENAENAENLDTSEHIEASESADANVSADAGAGADAAADSASAPASAPAPSDPTSVPASASVPVAAPSSPIDAAEGDAKHADATPAEEAECLPDDKRDVPAATPLPTELSVLSTAPRDNIVSAIWHPGNLEQGTLPHELILVYRSGYAGYRVTDAGQLEELFFYSFKEPCQAAAWDPLHTQLLAVAQGRAVRVINISDNSVLCCAEQAHAEAVQCMEFNPNRPSILCTGGRDGVVTLWHVSRRGMEVEKTVQAHTHW